MTSIDEPCHTVARPAVKLAWPTRERPFALLQELRALAVASVLLQHLASVGLGHQLGTARPLGRAVVPVDLGVPLFFLITGFLLFGRAAAQAQAGQPFELARFWRDRAARILPAYWIAFGALAVWPGLPRLDGTSFVPNLALLQAWLPHHSRSGIGPAWTLCAEVAFYATVPLLVWMLAQRGGSGDARGLLRRQLAACAILWACSLAFSTLITRPDASPRTLYLAESFPGVLHFFALGMALGSIYAYQAAIGRPARRDWTLHWWGMALGLHLVWAGTLAGSSGWQRTPDLMLQGLVDLCVLAPVATYRPARRAAARFPLLAWIGTISYGIYLWQYPILVELAARMHPRDSVAAAWGFRLSGVAASVALGAASFYLVERPARRLKAPRGGVAPLAAEPA